MTTFSKRRAGIYKKLNELIFTCNAEVGFLVFSKAETPFTFSHTSMESVFDKSMNPIRRKEKDSTDSLVDAYKRERINHMNEEYEKVLEAIEEEKDRTQVLEKVSEEREIKKYWWKAPVQELDVNETQQMHDAFVELHAGLCDEIFVRLLHAGAANPSG
ncbi:PREDICTED: agamous-like MADS-box protein AGL61 [Tarenaya hassleriana]|uniref:agamous-like MADS-box protein AGL61 n=1 Tax=Tarenaya hassleriana TaxID=28532 RepID=UPI00053C4976|nr:PREDICTED: agamous-like MADS-box protein AGL61 [Tarenaya hassleriana]